jgi:hypothetical protein
MILPSDDPLAIEVSAAIRDGHVEELNQLGSGRDDADR